MPEGDKEKRFDLVEKDNMTGNDRTLWTHKNITREEAERVMEWREKNIVNRYSYEIVPTGTGPSE